MRRIALVTGSSRGIGRAIALQLAQGGYAVAVNGRSPESVQAVAAEIIARGGDAKGYVCDVTDAEAVARMGDAVERELGTVTALVNNAGIAQQKLLTDVTDTEWHRMMATHVDGAFYTCRRFLPGMIRRQTGSIVNISSMWGQVGGSCEVSYSAAKAALIGFTRALAKEVGPSGIRVNCVAPGVIQTDMMAGFDEAALQELREETPLCRLGTVQDVAQAAAFLLSDAAGFITGQVLAPNGGMIIG